MTFTEIQTEIVERMNLSSNTALARVGRSINERYKWLASELGFETVGRAIATTKTRIDDRSVIFGPSPIAVTKILSVFNEATTPPTILTPILFDDMRNQTTKTSDSPREYAIQLMGAKSITIFLSDTPATSYALKADVLANLSTLSGEMEPSFSEDYHNLLVYGGMATEYDKLADTEVADKFEAKFHTRLAELRLQIAKSAYLNVYQGKTVDSRRGNRRVVWNG